MTLKPVLVACHRFQRTQVDPLSVPAGYILICECVLISRHVPTNVRAQDLNLSPHWPDSHMANVHCSPVEKPTELPQQACYLIAILHIL